MEESPGTSRESRQKRVCSRHAPQRREHRVAGLAFLEGRVGYRTSEGMEGPRGGPSKSFCADFKQQRRVADFRGLAIF